MQTFQVWDVTLVDTSLVILLIYLMTAALLIPLTPVIDMIN